VWLVVVLVASRAEAQTTALKGTFSSKDIAFAIG
jgi:hypothetical protein